MGGNDLKAPARRVREIHTCNISPSSAADWPGANAPGSSPDTIPRSRLYEMRPRRSTPAHETDLLAELVCSNSLRSNEALTAIGLLKEEMASLDSLVMAAAFETAIPAGKALAVDRTEFARFITRSMEDHPAITLVREEIAGLDDPRLENADKIVGGGRSPGQRRPGRRPQATHRRKGAVFLRRHRPPSWMRPAWTWTRPSGDRATCRKTRTT